MKDDKCWGLECHCQAWKLEKEGASLWKLFKPWHHADPAQLLGFSSKGNGVLPEGFKYVGMVFKSLPHSLVLPVTAVAVRQEK